MPATRTINNLTEGWPDAPENDDLQVFAAGARDGRAELSAPALDRIESLLATALDGRTARPAELPSRWRIAGQGAGVAARLAAPYAAAACLLVAAGVWVNHRVATTPVPVGPTNAPVDGVTEDRKPAQPGQPPRDVPQAG